MTDERATIARLAHDVGKYVARIARNLPPTGPIPPTLARMLESDLYSLSGGRSASALFLELSSSLPPHPPLADTTDAALKKARECFSEIDALEARVRAGEESSQRRAAALALEVSDALSSLLREDGE